jgi:uncharacterized membrane protein YkoI
MARLFVKLALVAGGGLFYGGLPVAASDEHDEVRELRTRGDILPLAEILGRPELAGKRVLEAELERKKGRMVYELEMLESDGQVSKGFFDAATGEALGRDWED